MVASNKLKATSGVGASIMAFSARGHPMLDAYTLTQRFIGLIDPSVRRYHLTHMRPKNAAILSGSSDRVATFGNERFKKLDTAILKGRRCLRPSEARPLEVPQGLHGSVQVAAVVSSATCGPLVQEPAPAALAGVQRAEAGGGRQAEGACMGERGRGR